MLPKPIAAATWLNGAVFGIKTACKHTVKIGESTKLQSCVCGCARVCAAKEWRREGRRAGFALALPPFPRPAERGLRRDSGPPVDERTCLSLGERREGWVGF